MRLAAPLPSHAHIVRVEASEWIQEGQVSHGYEGDLQHARCCGFAELASCGEDARHGYVDLH